MKVLDLFSGIGGFSLGLERAGFTTVAFCEIEPFCRAVLKKHWPHVPCYEDVRTLTADRLRADGISVDVICGGFPCQDISDAGLRLGIEGDRSWLWKEYARLIGELRPQYVIVENVAALLSRGMDTVVGDLATLGYDSEWHCIPAAFLGAPHRRDRVWIVAYPPRVFSNGSGDQHEHRIGQVPEPGDGRRTVTSTNAYGQSLVGAAIARPKHNPWHAEPEVGRVVDGLSHGMVADELKALGNAVVPQIPELIGRAILAVTGQAQCVLDKCPSPELCNDFSACDARMIANP